MPKISACGRSINKCVRFRRPFFRPFLWANKERDNIHQSFIPEDVSYLFSVSFFSTNRGGVTFFPRKKVTKEILSKSKRTFKRFPASRNLATSEQSKISTCNQKCRSINVPRLVPQHSNPSISTQPHSRRPSCLCSTKAKKNVHPQRLPASMNFKAGGAARP